MYLFQYRTFHYLYVTITYSHCSIVRELQHRYLPNLTHVSTSWRHRNYFYSKNSTTPNFASLNALPNWKLYYLNIYTRISKRRDNFQFHFINRRLAIFLTLPLHRHYNLSSNTRTHWIIHNWSMFRESIYPYPDCNLRIESNFHPREFRIFFNFKDSNFKGIP